MFLLDFLTHQDGLLWSLGEVILPLSKTNSLGPLLNSGACPIDSFKQIHEELLVPEYNVPPADIGMAEP